MWIKVCLLLSIASWFLVAGDDTAESYCNYKVSYYHQAKLSRSERKEEECSKIRKFFDWFPLINLCDNGKKITYRRETYTKQIIAYKNQRKCCSDKGFYEVNGTCIKGCHEGKYGDNCTEVCNCPENAYRFCEKENGNCTCKPGYTGKNCSQECDSRHYRENCIYECPCQNNETCDKIDGHCNCTNKPGWMGTTCDERCPSGTYGINCTGTCDCKSNQSCDHVTGCLCQAGYKGDNCTEGCSKWTFGLNCRQQCCCSPQHTESCDAVNGTCSCKQGYTGRCCYELCGNGTYGRHCEERCNCSSFQECLPTNGSCYCHPGLMGPQCHLNCSDWTYGPGCIGRCECKRDSTATCNAVDGQCLCKDGFSGKVCDVSSRFRIEEERVVDIPNSTSLSSTLKYSLIGCALVLMVIIVVGTLVFIMKKKKSRKKNRKLSTSTSNPAYSLELPQNDDAIPVLSNLRENEHETAYDKLGHTSKQFKYENAAFNGQGEYGHLRSGADDQYDDFQQRKMFPNSSVGNNDYDSMRQIRGDTNDSAENAYDGFKKTNQNGTNVIQHDVYDSCSHRVLDEGQYDEFERQKPGGIYN